MLPYPFHCFIVHHPGGKKIYQKSENILNYAFRLKTIYQRAYPSNKLETQEELASQLQFLRQKFLQGLESELQQV